MREDGTRATRPIPLRPARPCPICGRKSVRDAYPFCSKRCADVDLGRWLTSAYAIPAEEAGEADEPAPDGEEDR